MRSRPFLALVLVGVLASAASCGVPDEDRAKTAGADDVPFGLLEDEPLPPPATVPTEAATLIRVYLFNPGDQRLVGVDRSIEEGADVNVSDVVDTLLAGPTLPETAQGIVSALPRGAVTEVTLLGGVANVDLDEDFSELDGSSQLRAIAQLVYTLTSRPGVGRVAFTLVGQPVEIPRGDGSLTSGSVSRDGYRELAPTAT